jgi:hypothetical protein
MQRSATVDLCQSTIQRANTLAVPSPTSLSVASSSPGVCLHERPDSPDAALHAGVPCQLGSQLERHNGRGRSGGTVQSQAGVKAGVCGLCCSERGPAAQALIYMGCGNNSRLASAKALMLWADVRRIADFLRRRRIANSRLLIPDPCSLNSTQKRQPLVPS